MYENRRSEIEIIGDILTLSLNGARKTEILYQANLSYTQLKNYLPFLLKNNILEIKTIQHNGNNACKMYHITSKVEKLLGSIHKTLSFFQL